MKKVWVNVYKIERCYGGPEEGGWWYNHYECIHSVETTTDQADSVRDNAEREYGFVNEGDIYSVRGGSVLSVLIEDTQAESETRERPHYE